MINDLFWILESPSLIKTKDPTLMPGTDWLNKANTTRPFKTQATDTNHQQNTPQRLGLYYENLIEIIIKRIIQPIELKRNIQVIDGKKTVGEYDFLGRLKNSNFHLECAIKFYLCIGDGSQLSHFIGPNQKDRLDRKYKRLLQHQLMLSQTPAGANQCKALNIIPSKRIMLLQGYLFYHIHHNAPISNIHPDIHPHHLRGWWATWTECVQLDPHCHYGILEKPYWLSSNCKKAMTLNQLQTSLEKSDRPKLVYRFNKKTGVEIDRGFIVPDQWSYNSIDTNQAG